MMPAYAISLVRLRRSLGATMTCVARAMTEPKKIFKSGKPFRWLIVGYGRVGRCHAAAIAHLDEADLCGIVSREPLAEDPLPPVFNSLSIALKETQADGVIVATPHHTHVELAHTALQHGIPVLCEKPAGCSATDAQCLVDEATRLKLPLGVVLNQRANPHCLWLQQQIAAGQLQCINLDIRGALGRLSGWHADARLAGGGLLRTVGIHYLDLLRYFFGEPDWLSGQLADSTDQRPGVDDTLVVSARFGGGRDVTLATISLSAVADRSAGPVTIDIEARNARLRLRGAELEWVEGIEPPPPSPPTPPGLIFGPGHLGILQQATRNLREGKDFPLPLREHVPLLRSIDRLYEATWGEPHDITLRQTRNPSIP